MWYIYTMECYSAIKRNEIGSFVETWMDLETVIQSEANQKEKNKCIYIYIFLINLFIFYLFLFLATLGLRCCARAFFSCSKRGLLFIAVRRLLIVVSCLVSEHGL